MRRFVLAAVLAIAFHGLLFTLRFEEPKARLTRPPKPLTLSLDQAPAPATPALSVSKLRDAPDTPSSLKPPPREKPSQEQKITPVRKAIKRTAPPFPSRHEQQDSTRDQADAAGNEVPPAGPSEGPSHSARAALEPGSPSDPMIERDATPLYRLNPVPEYPFIGRKRGYQGTVILEVLVTREGRVGDLRVVASSGYSVLDQAALASVRTWIFDPGMKAGKKVDMWVKVPVRFRLE